MDVSFSSPEGLFSKLTEKLRGIGSNPAAADCDCGEDVEPAPLSGARATVQLLDLFTSASEETLARAKDGAKVSHSLYRHPCTPALEAALLGYEVDRMNAATRLAATLCSLLPEDERPELAAPKYRATFSEMTTADALGILAARRAERRTRIAAAAKTKAEAERRAAAAAAPDDHELEDYPTEAEGPAPQPVAAGG